mgnify:CR=1 FL=1
MGNATKKQFEYAQQISQALNIAMPDGISFAVSYTHLTLPTNSLV